MSVTYDPEVDALSIRLRRTNVTTQEISEGVAAEFDSDGRLAGIEILDAAEWFEHPESLRKMVQDNLPPSDDLGLILDALSKPLPIACNRSGS